MERHTLSALITLDPSAPHDLVHRYVDGTQATGVVQSCGRYLPAWICCNESPSPQRVIHATVHLPLLPGEADALFASGQVFTVWADATVSDVCARGEGLLGDAVILGRELTSDDQHDLRTAAHRRHPYRPAIPPPRTGHGPPAAARRP